MKNNKNKSQLRIIAGKWRGQKISFADTEGLRPTPDRVRETLFNWLQGEVGDSRCLDLFAGSGALSFEALSRGAAQVVMMDRSAQAVAHLHKTAGELQVKNMSILSGDYRDHLDHALLIEPFDIVFLDPPFAGDLLAPACQWIVRKNMIAAGGWLYWESERPLESMMPIPQGWNSYRSAKAGQVYYGLWQKDA